MDVLPWLIMALTILLCYRIVENVQCGEAFERAMRVSETVLELFRTFPPTDAKLMGAEMVRSFCRTPLERRMAILALAELYWRILDGRRGIRAPERCSGWRDRLDLAFAYLGSDDPKVQSKAGPVVASIPDAATFPALTRAMKHTVDAFQRWEIPKDT